MEKPGGRRYEACTDYHQRIQMGDEVHGYEAEAVSSVNALTHLHRNFNSSSCLIVYLGWVAAQHVKLA